MTAPDCDSYTKSDCSRRAASTNTARLRSIVEQLQQPYPHNRVLNIVCHGHSVPAGYFVTPEVRTFESYPHLLHVALKNLFPYAAINVIVTAIGGEDSESGAARFDTDVLSLRPGVVTIDYALNDRRIGLRRAESAWRQMIESAMAQGIVVVLLTPSGDLEADLSDLNDPVHLHADLVRNLATHYRILLADSELSFRTHSDLGRPLGNLMSDTRHPNRAGHELIAAELVRCIVENCRDR